MAYVQGEMRLWEYETDAVSDFNVGWKRLWGRLRKRYSMVGWNYVFYMGYQWLLVKEHWARGAK